MPLLTSFPVSGNVGRRKGARRKHLANRSLQYEPLEERTVLSGWLANSYGVGEDPGHDIAVDSDGCVYVAGSFQGTTIFTPTTGDNVELINDGTQEDALVVKLNPNGQFVWARRIGGPGDDMAGRIAVAESGDVYVAGTFHDTATFGATQLTSAGYRDIFVTKLNGDGEFQWAVRAGGPDAPQPILTYEDTATGLTLGSDGSIYLTGFFQGEADFGDFDVTSLGGTDAFLAKLGDYGSSGQFQAVTTLGTTGNDQGKAVAVGNSSDGEKIYLAALLADHERIVAQFTPPADEVPWTASWEQPVAGGSYYALAVYQETETTHYIYVGAGSEQGTGLVKLDAEGNVVTPWSPLVAEGGFDVADLAVDSTGVYATGAWLNSLVDFDPDPAGTADMGEYLFMYDAYIWKLSHDGQFLAARRMGSVDSPGDHGRAIAVQGGSIYTTGSFKSASALFDIGSEYVLPTDPTGGGGDKMFVLKTSQEMGGIFGRAFNDLSNDGVWDAGEPPLAGFSVSAVLGGEVKATTQTGQSGEFVFPHLREGIYDVRLELPEGWTQTGSGLQGVTVEAGQFVSSNPASDYFGAHRPVQSYHYESTDVPKNLPNRPWKYVESTLVIPDSYAIFDMEINITVTGEPVIYLNAPDETRLRVYAPYTQTDAFNYTNIHGTWTLEVAGGERGQLTAWSFDILGAVAPSAPGITVQPTLGLVTTEAGGTAAFTVVLDFQPTAAVTIAVSSGDPSEGVFVGENELGFLKLAFDQNNWDTPQTVTVTGVDDDVEDGDVSYSIDVAVDPLLTVDSDYKTLDSIAVSATNVDNDGQADYFESQDVPKTIADPHPVKGAKPVTSQLVIASTGITVGVIDVAVTIAHTSMSDLTVTLTSPAGTTAPLAYSNAWDLVAADAFQGQSLDGTWVLTVADTVKNGITGTLTAWSITVAPLAQGGSTEGDSGLLAAGMMNQRPSTGLLPPAEAGAVDADAANATADDTLFLEQHTEPAASSTTDQPVSSTSSSVDDAIAGLDLDPLEDQLLDDLALTVL